MRLINDAKELNVFLRRGTNYMQLYTIKRGVGRPGVLFRWSFLTGSSVIDDL